jgi:hypothetical protein
VLLDIAKGAPLLPVEWHCHRPRLPVGERGEEAVRPDRMQARPSSGGYPIEGLVEGDRGVHEGEVAERQWEVANLHDRGRDRPCGRPPAQIPACAANALGSCLGFWRRSVSPGMDASRGRVVATGSRYRSSAPS